MSLGTYRCMKCGTLVESTEIAADATHIGSQAGACGGKMIKVASAGADDSPIATMHAAQPPKR